MMHRLIPPTIGLAGRAIPSPSMELTPQETAPASIHPFPTKQNKVPAKRPMSAAYLGAPEGGGKHDVLPYYLPYPTAAYPEPFLLGQRQFPPSTASLTPTLTFSLSGWCTDHHSYRDRRTKS